MSTYPPPPSTPSYSSSTPPPSNYLVWSILSTLFCCLPFGIVSIVFASQVNSKWAAGDQAGALASSSKAKTWLLVAVGTGLAIDVIYLIIVLSVGLAGTNS